VTGENPNPIKVPMLYIIGHFKSATYQRYFISALFDIFLKGVPRGTHNWPMIYNIRTVHKCYLGKSERIEKK